MRTEGLAKKILERFQDVRIVKGNSSLVLVKKFPDETKVVVQISPSGEVLSTYYSRITDQAVCFVEEIKEYLWRESRVGK